MAELNSGAYIMNIEKIREIIGQKKRILDDEYKVKTIGVFGSYARGGVGEKSDVDILIEFKDPPDIFTFINLEEFLSNLLGVKVDLATKMALKPMIKDKILRETIYI